MPPAPHKHEYFKTPTNKRETKVLQQQDLFEETRAPKRVTRGYEVAFLKWWQVYPRRIGKIRAEKNYISAVKLIQKREQLTKSDAIQKLLDAAHSYSQSSRDTSIQYIPHPATWLAQGRWDDEPDRPQQREAEPSSRPDCEICGNLGNIEIVNPRWSSRQFDHTESEARSWCRSTKAGPLIVAVCCTCRKQPGKFHYIAGSHTLASDARTLWRLS